MPDTTLTKKSWLDKFLDGLERVCNKLPPPAIMFVYLFVIVSVLSAVLSLMGVSALNPATNEIVKVENPISSDGLMYGIKAEQVKDIITDYAITYLPQVPPYVRGVINLRGQIIPMLDIRLRLGKMPQENFCGIVVDVDGSMVGILVDMVEQMVDVPLDAILPVPTSNGQAMVSGMCTLPDGNTMLELDCELLLHD